MEILWCLEKYDLEDFKGIWKSSHTDITVNFTSHGVLPCFNYGEPNFVWSFTKKIFSHFGFLHIVDCLQVC